MNRLDVPSAKGRSGSTPQEQKSVDGVTHSKLTTGALAVDQISLLEELEQPELPRSLGVPFLQRV